MSNTIAKLLAGTVETATGWMKPYRRALTRARVAERLVQRWDVPTERGTVRFVCPTARSLHDPAGLYDGEPETLRWLDSLPEGAVMWDIGANVGTYALYAARMRGARVIAFEPSAATFAALMRNIEANGVSEQVQAFCMALADETKLDFLYMADSNAGHSMHAFGDTRSVQGDIKVSFAQAVPGMTVDAFMETFRPPPPEHVKLDVDSIEEKILAGGARTFALHTRSLMVEIERSAPDRGEGIRARLREIGFTEDTAFHQPGDRRNVLFRRVSECSENVA